MAIGYSAGTTSSAGVFLTWAQVGGARYALYLVGATTSTTAQNIVLNVLVLQFIQALRLSASSLPPVAPAPPLVLQQHQQQYFPVQVIQVQPQQQPQPSRVDYPVKTVAYAVPPASV